MASRKKLRKIILIGFLVLSQMNQTLPLLAFEGEATSSSRNIATESARPKIDIDAILNLSLKDSSSSAEMVTESAQATSSATFYDPNIALSQETTSSARLKPLFRLLKQKIKKPELLKNNLQIREMIEIDLGDYDESDQLTVQIQDFNNNEITNFETKIENRNLKVKRGPNFRPGKYSIQVSTSKEVLINQDFTWGVLAINTNKSIYMPEEKAQLALAVLNGQGMMVCDAKLSLKIVSPLGETEELSTEQGTIKVNFECQMHSYTEKPDYEAIYQTKEVGAYKIELLAETQSGNFTVSDSFEVRDQVNFDIERLGPTRIYPPATYTVGFNISANEDFEGMVEEIIPSSFGTFPLLEDQEESQDISLMTTEEIALEFDQGKVLGASISRSYNQEEIKGDVKVIRWFISLKEGEQIKLGYRFKTPDISPQFYLLGPLKFINIDGQNVFQETRQWQIAADAVTSYSSGSGNWTSPVTASVTIELHGGGGGGGFGGTTNKDGGGGGAGGQVSLVTFNATKGTNYAYSVGSIGVGGTSAGQSGKVGGDTTFVIAGSTKTAKGGAYGGAFSGSTGAAGVGSTVGGVGDVVYKGGNGGAGTGNNSGGGGGGAGSTGNGNNATGTPAITGGAAKANNGGAGGDGNIANAAAGLAGSDYGGGGGGGTKGKSGGDGAPGYILITYPDNTAPTVVLNSPDDASSDLDTTPPLTFTGTDANYADDIEYQVQVDTQNDFQSGTTVNTYYFNDETPTDNDSLWTDDTNAFDGSTSTYAYSSTLGTTSTNELYGNGTNAPVGSTTITQVRARIYGTGSYVGKVCKVNVGIYTTSLGELLGTPFIQDTPAASPTWGNYVTLSTPIGGWDWSKLQALETTIYLTNETDATQFTGRVYRVEIEVTSGGPLLSALSSTDDHANWSGTGDPHPWSSGNAVTYTVQDIDSLLPDIYYWRVRGIDPSGTNTYGDWSEIRNFEVLAPNITISGISDMTSGTVAVGVGTSIRSGKTATIQGDGTWAISDVAQPNTNEIVTVWVDSADVANESTGVTKYSGPGNLVGLVLNKNVLSIGNSSGTANLSVTNLSQYDNSKDEDVMHGVVSNTLTVDDDNVYTSEKVNILSGNTLTIGSSETLATHHLTITGALTSTTTAAYNVAGDWTNNGTFTQATSTVTFNGSSAQTISGSTTTTFNNLTLTGSITASSTFNMNGTFNVSGGTFTPSAGTITMNNGSSISNSGTLVFQGLSIAASATVTTSASFTMARTLTVNSSGNFSPSGGTITMDTGNWAIVNSGTLVFSGLTIAELASSLQTSSFSIGGTLTVNAEKTLGPSAGTITMVGNNWAIDLSSGGNAYFYNWTIAGTPSTQPSSEVIGVQGALTVNSGVTLAPTTGAIMMMDVFGSSPSIVNNGGSTTNLVFNDLYISADTTTSSDFTIQGVLTVDAVSLLASGGTITMATTGWGIDNFGTLVFSGLTIAGTPSSQPASSFSIGGTLKVDLGKTLAPTAGTITMIGSPSTILNDGGATTNLIFNNLTVGTGSVLTNSDFTVNGALSIDSSSFVASGGTITMATTNWAIINSSGMINFSGLTIAETPSSQPTSSFYINSGALTINSGKTLAPTDGIITIADGSIINNGGASNNLSFNNLSIEGTSTTSSDFTVNGYIDVNGGNFSPSGGTITMATTNWAISSSGTLIFSGLTIAETPSVSGQPSSDFSVSGALTVNSGKTLAPFDGTVTMTGGSIANSGTLTFYNLTLTGSASTTSTFTVANDLTNNGTLTVGSGTGVITTNGNVTGSGTMSLTAGTFQQVVAVNKNFGSSSGVNNWTFNNLKVNNSDASNAHIITPNAGTGQIIIGGTFTLGDSGSQNITFDNETSNDRVFDLNGDFTISSKGIFSASSTQAFNIASSYSNSGTFTANSGTVIFDATSTGKNLAGRLNNAITNSAFYKLVFNGSGGGWTIQDPVKISKANGTDTFLIQQGTVTLGDGDGDDMEINGKMLVGSTAGITTFQVFDNLPQGQEIIVDVNNNGTPSNCANCIITVGTTVNTDPQATFTLNENNVLRFNSYSSVQSGLTILASGKLNIQGIQTDSGTSTSGTSETVLEDTSKSWSTDQHNNKYLRMTSGLAFGKIYEITDTITNSLTRADNSSADSTIQTISLTNEVIRTICSNSTGMITANREGIGRYLHDQTGTSGWFRIVNSTNDNSSCSSPADSFEIIAEPNSFSTLSDGDTIDISDGIKANDNYEIIDYATVTAHSTNHGYISGGTGSETIAQYADISELGSNGFYFNSVNGANSNEGITIEKTRIYNNSYGLYLDSSSNNNSDYSKGIYNNEVRDNSQTGVSVYNLSSSNEFTHNNVFNNSTHGFDIRSSANNLTNNIAYRNGSSVGTHGFILWTASRNTLTNNVSYDNYASGFTFWINSKNNILDTNISFSNGFRGSDGHGFHLYSGSNNNVLKNNNSYGNYYQGFLIYSASQNILLSNNAYYNGITTNYMGILVWENSVNNILISNNSYYNKAVGIYLINASNKTKFINNNSYGNQYGFVTRDTIDSLIIADNYGIGSTNSLKDFRIGDVSSFSTGFCYSCDYNSTTQPSSNDLTGSFFVSLKNSSNNGEAKIIGDFVIPEENTETPQSESTQKFNYTNYLWEKSVSPHGYSGTGIEDGDLDYDISSSDLSSGPYAYRLTLKSASSQCDGLGGSAIFDVFRNEVDVGDALCGETYTDNNASVGLKFKIEQDIATYYIIGDTYTFVAWDASGDNNTVKNVGVINDSDSLTVNSGETLEIIGTSENRNVFSRAGIGGYNINIAGGSLNSQYTDFDYLKGNGLDIQTSSVVSDLDYNSFDNLIGTTNPDDAFITIASSIIGSGTFPINGIEINNTGGGADFNVNRTDSDDTGYWDFDSSTGDFDGEVYDGHDGADEAVPGMLRWDDSVTNQAPNSPSSLVQNKTNDTVLATGDWTNETSVKFTALASDSDTSSETLYLCVEKDDINTAFGDTEDLCGTGVGYSGGSIPLSVTVTGITEDTQYHWHARVKDEADTYSNWVAYGDNSDTVPGAARDFGIDATAPVGGIVYDGVETEMDIDFNDGSLSELSANWSGFEDLAGNSLFSDGFQSGGLTAWSANQTDGGDLSVSETALHGNYGLSALIDDTNWISVQDNTPDSETRYRVRFYVDLNGVSMPTDWDKIGLLVGNTASWTATFGVSVLYRTTTGYNIVVDDRTDAGDWSKATALYPITDAPHYIEIDFKTSSAPEANDGWFSLWIDGSLKETVTGIDNDTENTGAVIFGALDSSADVDGTIYLDDFVSNNDGTEIGAYENHSAGLDSYDYSIGTSIGGTEVGSWVNVGLGTSATVTGLTLKTSTLYYFNVRAVDNAGNVQNGVSSDGQMVAPNVTFSVSPAVLNFDNLNNGNSYTNSQETTLTTSTNAYGGYVVRSFVTDYLRSVGVGYTIPDFDGGSYATPGAWGGGNIGFGYTSSDTTIQGADKFSGGTLYAPFSQEGPGDIIADHTNNVTGNPINNEQFTITYKVKADAAQQAANYVTTTVYTITPQY